MSSSPVQAGPFARIVILKPCCIGDVIFATPLLMALRRAYPEALIDWAVSTPAAGALEGHPALHALIPTGKLANPASRAKPLVRLVWTLRRGHYDLIVVPDRSRLLAVVPLMAYIPHRAGLDSAGRGFSYNYPAHIDPQQIRHESEIYLDIGRALGIDVEGVWSYAPPPPEAAATATTLLSSHQLTPGRFLMVHPGGGVNAGMSMVQKRYPPRLMAALVKQIEVALEGAQIVIVGAASDQEAISVLKTHLEAAKVIDLSEKLTLRQIGALAVHAALYIGNDNGVGHLAAASGAKVLMIFGPSDPRRYAPFVPPDQARAVWRPIDLPPGGVSAGIPLTFDWERDGISVSEAFEAAQSLLHQR